MTTTDTTEDQANGADAPTQVHAEPISADVLQNIPVTISVEVGRAVLKINDLMRLSQGSVVELDRIAGEPLDLLVNNTVVAQGEDRKSTRLNSSHSQQSRMPSSA